MFSLISNFAAHTSTVSCLKLGRKSASVLATGGDDKRVNLWSLASTAPTLSLAGHASQIESVTLDPSEEIVVAGSSHGTIKLWDLVHAKVIRTLTGHKASVCGVEFHPFGEFFASSSDDGIVKVWDVRRRGCIQTYTGHVDAVLCLKITPDGRWIASGARNGTLKLWDMTAGKILHTFNDHTSTVVSTAFSPIEAIQASIGADGSIKVHDLRSFDLVSAIPSNVAMPHHDYYPRGQARVLDFSPDGSTLVAGFSNSLERWRWEPVSFVESLQVPWNGVADLWVGESGALVAGSLDMNFVSVWKGQLGEVVSDCDMAVDSIETAFRDVSLEAPKLTIQLNMPKYNEEVLSSHLSASSMLPSAPLPSASSGHTRSMSTQLGKSYDNTDQPTEQVQRQSVASIKQLQDMKYRKSLNNLTDFADSSEDNAPEASVRRSASSRISTTRSSRSEKPLGLDVARFVQSVRRTGEIGETTPIVPVISPVSSDEEIVDAMLSRHASVVSILGSRLTSLRVVHGAWDDGGVGVGGRGVAMAMDALGQLDDPAVTVDVLRVLNIRPRLISLESASKVLKFINGVLFEGYEEYVMTACTTIRLLIKNFAGIVMSTLEAAESGRFSRMSGINGEERLQKCRSCHGAFLNLYPVLDSLSKSPGHVGVAIRDTIKELS
ncbi:Katanin p80 WD40 repeat-containing subunit B1, partial [Nowakowskiella sp. JEL0078]